MSKAATKQAAEFALGNLNCIPITPRRLEIVSEHLAMIDESCGHCGQSVDPVARVVDADGNVRTRTDLTNGGERAVTIEELIPELLVQKTPESRELRWK